MSEALPAACMALTAALTALAATAGIVTAPADAASATGRLPPELAAALEAKSQGYARRALKFTCRERRREALYEQGVAREESVKESDYLLVRDDAALEGFAALRTKPGARSGKAESIAFPFPEPFLWSALFDPRLRSLVHFETGDWRTTPWRLAIPISWASSAPVLDGRRITAWSGTIEIEYRTGNLIRVVARPTFQDQRINAELTRYLTAFRFLGFSTAPPPLGVELTVEFDYEHEGFTYPSRLDLVTFRQIGRERRQVVERRVIEHSGYRFFGARVEDHIPPLTWRPPLAATPEADAP